MAHPDAGLIKPIQLRSAAQPLDEPGEAGQLLDERRLPADVCEVRGSEPQRLSAHVLESPLIVCELVEYK
jgi:hypothetical protein